MAWQMWLGAPIAVTLIAGIALWWRARPRPEPPVHRRVRDHRRFLDDLDRHATIGRDQPQSVRALDRPDADIEDAIADDAADDAPGGVSDGAEAAPSPPS